LSSGFIPLLQNISRNYPKGHKKRGALSPLQERYRELTADPTHIDSILADGADRARPTAEKVLAEVKRKVGLG